VVAVEAASLLPRDVCDLCANTDLGGPIPTVYHEDGHMGDDRTIHGCNATQILSCKPGDNEGEVEYGLSPGTQDLFTLERGWGSDSDLDGVRDCYDNCRKDPNPEQEDLDVDGLGDACDPDDDGDGVKDGSDDCPAAYNPDQADADGDGIGDACERCAPEAAYALSFKSPPPVDPVLQPVTPGSIAGGGWAAESAGRR